MVAQKAEQRRRFKAVLCTKPRDFDSIRAERKRSEKEGTAIIPPIDYGEENDDEIKLLDGFFLVTVFIIFIFQQANYKLLVMCINLT